MMLVALMAFGFFSAVRSSEVPLNPPLPSKISQFIIKLFNATPQWTVGLPATLLKMVAYFKDMGFWKSATFDAVVWVAVVAALKVAYDKNQERKKRSVVNKKLQEILDSTLASYDEAQQSAEAETSDIEDVASETIA